MNECMKIINPVAKELLLAELTEERLLRKANKGDNLVYVFTAKECPNLMLEIGRIRELAFRAAGGGTGKEVDIDDYDTGDTPYHQLIVWNQEVQEILGGYRYIRCLDIMNNAGEELDLATNHMFHFSEKFKTEYLPHTLELGRSFIHPRYQASNNKNMATRSIFVLDNLWDGLGALVLLYPEMKYLFGKITMYPHYNNDARKLLTYFFRKYFNDEENLVYPEEPMEVPYNKEEFDTIFTGNTYKENYNILSKKIRSLGENIPPLFNAYMNLSPSMKHFGTAINYRFGNVEETAILLTVEDIYETKKKRHLGSFIPNIKFNLAKKFFNKQR